MSIHLSRVLSTVVSAALVWLSPGFGASQAFAQSVAANVAGTAVIPMVAPIPFAAPGTAAGVSVGLGQTQVPGLQQVSVVAAMQLSPLVAPSARAAVAGRTNPNLGLAKPGAISAGRVAVGALAEAQAPGAARTTKVVARMAVGVTAALRSAGKVSDLGSSRAAGLGERLQQVLVGERASARAAVEPDAVVSNMGALRHDSGLGTGRPELVMGKAAGWDSIHRAAQETGPSGPSSPVPPGNGRPGEGGFGGGRRPPFFARLVASGMAFAPASYFGLPLLAAGAFIPGGLIVVAGAGLAVLPWLSASSSKLILAIPGVAILALGVVTALTLPGWSMAVGGLIAFAGWGFTRFATGSREHPGSVEQMSAIFGALSATVAAGLVLGAFGGWVALGVTALSSLFAARLLAELPQWFYEGVGHTFNAALKSTRGVHRVLGSIRTDTVLFDRLVRLTERHVKQFGWFAWIWLGALWGPALISEAFQWVLSAAAGVALTIVQSPALFGWGALNQVREKHWIFNRYAITFANWGRESFLMLQASKTSFFNPIERPLLKLANSKNRVVSLLGGLTVRLAQYVWLAGVLTMAVPVVGILFFHSFWRPSDEYVPELHGLSAMRLPSDPLPSEKPDEKDEPVGPTTEPFFPRLIGAGVALTPLYFFGLPFLTLAAPWAGLLFVGAGLAVAAMPLMPQATPAAGRVIPGVALGLAGLAVASLGGSVLVGLLAALAGWGLANFATKSRDAERRYYVTDPEYVGAFFGALGAITALGVALAGTGGWLGLGLQGGGLLVSALATLHLPRWVWSGARTAASSLTYSPGRVYRVMNFWDGDTKFYRNLKSWWSSWSRKSGWHWSWLWPTLGAQLLAEAYDFAVAAAAGVALAAVRLPLTFLWGAAYRISPNAPATRFIGGFTRSWIDRSEGSKEAVFDKWVAPLIPGIDRAAESRRPTIGALFYLTLARFVQAAWLARIVLWSPVILIQALIDGYKAVKAGPPAEGEPDRLNPAYL